MTASKQLSRATIEAFRVFWVLLSWNLLAESLGRTFSPLSIFQSREGKMIPNKLLKKKNKFIQEDKGLGALFKHWLCRSLLFGHLLGHFFPSQLQLFSFLLGSCLCQQSFDRWHLIREPGRARGRLLAALQHLLELLHQPQRLPVRPGAGFPLLQSRCWKKWEQSDGSCQQPQPCQPRGLGERGWERS